MTSKSVATIGTMAVATTDRPDHIKTGKRGSESVTLDDLTIPRVDIIQDLSPQHKKSKPEYIEGAEAGMMFNSVSSELYGKSVLFVPVFMRKEWIIWGDRQKNHEGFFGAYPSEAEANAALAEREDADKCEVVKTDQQFGLIVDSDSSPEDPKVSEVVVSMSKSKLKISRKLNSIIQMTEEDRFARLYELSVVDAQNAQNQDYYNFNVRQLGFCPEALYNKAEAMYKAISSGERDVNREYENSAEEAPSEAESEY